MRLKNTLQEKNPNPNKHKIPSPSKQFLKELKANNKQITIKPRKKYESAGKKIAFSKLKNISFSGDLKIVMNSLMLYMT